MYPILTRYGPFFLYSYTLVMGLGIAAGFGLTAWLNRKTRLPYWMDGVLSGLLFGLVGGRIGFVIGHWAYFQERPNEAWQLGQGGLSYHGALFVGLFGFWLWGRRPTADGRPPITDYLSLLAPGFALAHIFGWLACWLEGCAYGRETTLGWLTADLPDEFGVFAVRYQTQLIGMLFSLVVFVVVWRWKNRDRFWVMMAGLGFGRFLITFLRGDPIPLFSKFRVDTLLDIALVVISLLILLQYIYMAYFRRK